MEYRIEKDTIGEVKVPKNVYWGPQTERSRSNFKIGAPGSMPMEIIHGFAYLKNAAVDRMFGFGLQQAIVSFDKQNLIKNETLGLNI